MASASGPAEDAAPSTSAESDTPALVFSSSSSNTPTTSQLDEDEYRSRYAAFQHSSMESNLQTDRYMHEYRDPKQHADIEDDEAEDDHHAEEEHDDIDASTSHHEVEPIDDIEASFLRCTKPVCSKTTLVSCLSSRSTSPGPLSPLLSDYDFSAPPSITSALSDSECGSEPPSANRSRRSSAGTPSEASSQRVRFKKGCVITEVNLTWAPASYDRAPIAVAESLDIKRCHSLDDDGECDSGSDNDYDNDDDEDEQQHDDECDEGYEREDHEFEDGEIDACGQWVQDLHCDDGREPSEMDADEIQEEAEEEEEEEDDEIDEKFYYYSSAHTTSAIPIAHPPSPPLPSSPCTSAQVTFAYQNAFGGSTPTQSSIMRQRFMQECGEAPGSPPSRPTTSSTEITLPPLVHDDSSCSDSSSNEECHAAYVLSTAQMATPVMAPSTPSTPATIKDFYIDDSLNASTTTLTSSSATRQRRDESPSNVGDQPVRKVPRYAACLDRFSKKQEDLYSNCDALGGF